VSVGNLTRCTDSYAYSYESNGIAEPRIGKTTELELVLRSWSAEVNDVTRWSKLDFCGSLWVGKEDSPHNWAAMWRVVWVERPDFAFRGACSKLSHCILIQSIITTTAISHASLAISTDFDYYRCNLWPTTSMKYLYLSNPHETDFAGLPRRRRTPKLWHRGIRHPKTQSCRNLHRLCTPTAFYQPRKHQPNQLLDICAYCMGFRQFRQPPNAIYAK